MRVAARLFAFFFVFLFVFFVTKTTFAQENFQAPQNQTTNVNSDVPKNTHFWTQTVMLEVMSAAICQLAGIDPINPHQPCLGIDGQSGKIGFVQNSGGLIGATGSLISGTFLIPVHFSDYATYALNNFGFAKKSYAQNTGIGYDGLKPVVGLFTIFRNLAYLLMVFIFVVVGVAIMLRVRIDPRTVMTIQNQIPKLIIGLVMITFSYAIVGLLIDLMWVSTYFVINTLTPITQRGLVIEGITLSAPGAAQAIMAGEGGIVGLAAGGANGVGEIIKNVIASPQVADALKVPEDACGFGDVTCKISDVISGTLANLLTSAIGLFIGTLAGIIVFLIFVIAMLVALFKLLFALLKCFITVLLDTILAPFWILGGLLPGAGQSIGVGPWLRDVIANLAVFPAVVFLFLVARVIVDQLSIQSTVLTNFTPPLIGNAKSTNFNDFGSLIAVGFILAAPGVVEAVKRAFKASSGAGLGGAAVGVAAVGAVGGAIKNRAYYRWRNPATGEMQSGGVAFNVGQRAFRTVADTGVGRVVGQVTSPVSRVARWISKKPTTEEPIKNLSEEEIRKKIGGK